jgi:hypothetical protein
VRGALIERTLRQILEINPDYYTMWNYRWVQHARRRAEYPWALQKRYCEPHV